MRFPSIRARGPGLGPALGKTRRKYEIVVVAIALAYPASTLMPYLAWTVF
jgi:hypothetical protein